MVYLSEHPALAMLETLVHLGMDPSEIPDTFNLLRVQVPDEAEIERIEDLPPDWRDQLHDTRQRGDQWLRKARASFYPCLVRLCVNPKIFCTTPAPSR